MSRTTADIAGISTSRSWMPFSARHIPVITTAVVWIVMIAIAAFRYDEFFKGAVFLNLLRDNAFLGVTAIGMTFVILSGGIDLSVGSMIGFTSILLASMITTHHWPAPLAIAVALAIGTLLGSGMGVVIAYFGLPPFLVTLAGMFLMRGLAQVISLESLTIDSPMYDWIADFGFNHFPAPVILFVLALLVATFIAHQTRFGRATYAIGGSESSALLLGVPVLSTKIRIYALSGFCSAMGGVVYTLYTPAGNALAGGGLELDAIAAVVIGGTPLSGGVGYLPGTLLGVLILGTIQTIINYENLSSSWTRIATGILLLAFILLQQFVARQVSRRRGVKA